MLQLEQLELSPEQITDLADLCKMRQYSALLHLFRRLDSLATEQLVGFSDNNDAFERRGMVRGIRLGLEAVNSIYSQTHQGKEDDSTTNSGNSDKIREGTHTTRVDGGIRNAAESEPEPLGWSH